MATISIPKLVATQSCCATDHELHRQFHSSPYPTHTCYAQSNGPTRCCSFEKGMSMKRLCHDLKATLDKHSKGSFNVLLCSFLSCCERLFRSADQNRNQLLHPREQTIYGNASPPTSNGMRFAVSWRDRKVPSTNDSNRGDRFKMLRLFNEPAYPEEACQTHK